jgi:hypothetical protein
VIGSAVLDIGGDTGALVVYADQSLEGQEVEIARSSGPGHVAHNVVRARTTACGVVFAAVFPAVTAGEYKILDRDGISERAFVVDGGAVAEVDCRTIAGSSEDQ